MPDTTAECAETDIQPRIEQHDDGLPTIPLRSGGRCYGSSEDGGECAAFGLSFDSVDEWETHRAEYHPTACSATGCRTVVSYKRVSSPHSYCVGCVPDDPETVYGWRRVNVEAKCEVPRLDDDHPIEVALQGLEA